MSQGVIAIVDDEDALRAAVASLVRSLSYTTVTFGSAEDFFTSEQVSTTSCIITDLRMPDLSGLDLQERLIAEGYRIPIIFITGNPDDSSRARAMNAGAIAFLIKPIDGGQLIECMKKVVRA